MEANGHAGGKIRGRGIHFGKAVGKHQRPKPRRATPPELGQERPTVPESADNSNRYEFRPPRGVAERLIGDSSLPFGPRWGGTRGQADQKPAEEKEDHQRRDRVAGQAENWPIPDRPGQDRLSRLERQSSSACGKASG